jgi:uncharacterized cupredoxin-like copper-binding protein
MSRRNERRRQERRQQHSQVARQGTGAGGPASGSKESDGSHRAFDERWATVWYVVAVASLLGAQFVHWSVIDQHAEEWSAAGTFFFLLAVVEGFVALLVIFKLQPKVAAAGITVSAVPVVVWAWDRTFGLPFGPSAGVRGTVGRSDVLSVLFEIVTIVALVPFLRPGYGDRRPTKLDLVGKVVIAATIVYVGVFSYWAISGDQQAIHQTAASAADAEAAAAPPPTTSGVPAGPTTSAAKLIPTRTISYVGTEFRFDGPTTVEAGLTRIELHNLGDEQHEIQVARIQDATPTPQSEVDLEELFADGQFGLSTGPEIIAGTHEVAAGESVELIVDLTPGRYILSCAIPAPNGGYHYAQGMITLLTVTEGTFAATPASTTTT